MSHLVSGLDRKEPFCFDMGSSRWEDEPLVGKCSATRCSVAAPPPGVRDMVLAGPHKSPATTPCGGRERGATGAFGSGVAATPLLHTQNCGVSRDRGVATPWNPTGGGGV